MPVAKVCPSCATPLPNEAAFCFMCGSATPQGINKLTGELISESIDRLPSRALDRLRAALGANYELGALVGRGGFAEVFRLYDRRLKRELAVKALRPELTLSDALLSRFRREAETVAALRHPHIVPIYDIGEAEGLMYIIMPLIQGESLTTLLIREGPRPPREALRILIEAAEALAAAHEAGVVHRDVKPENIMLEGRGRRVQLMDFGIAKALDAAEGSGLTSTGILVGTPHYMSPEQASGELHLDHRSDQYSLAVVGYQMITGELPFDGESTRAVLFQQMVGVPRSLRDLVPDVPANIAFTIERALSKEPKDRYPSMAEFGEALAGADGWPPVSSPSEPRITAPREAIPTPPPVVAPPKRRRSAAVLASIGVVGLAAVAFAVIQPWTWRANPGAADSAAGQTADPSGVVQSPPSAPAAQRPESVIRAVRKIDSPPPLTCVTATRASRWREALPLCVADAEKGNINATRLVAGMYQRGDGVTQSDSAATAWYRRGIDKGDVQSAYQLGLILASVTGNQARDAEATGLLRRAAEANVPEAWPILAERYQQGIGVKRNEEEAAFWYRKAAEQGNPASQYNLGVMYARGRGVNKSEAEAAVWFLRAAEQGSVPAQYELGMAYVRGKGVTKSDSVGLAWLERAASQGHAEATKEAEKRKRG